MQTAAGREQAASSRARAVWRLLSQALDSVRADHPLRVLDCGGGTGTIAVPLAEHGAHVTVIDVSVDALATLGRRAADAGVGQLVRGLQGDAESLTTFVPAGSFDLVLAHGLLETLPDPVGAVRALADAVRPGGLVSLVVANPDAAVLARALTGDLAGALADLQDQPQRFGPRDALAACAETGLQVEALGGLGVFTELVPGDQAEGATDLLDQLEELAASRPPYRDIAGRVHLLARRPAGVGGARTE